MADCPGSGVVVDSPPGSEPWRFYWTCPTCGKFMRVEPVEPEGLAPRWKIVDHREAS